MTIAERLRDIRGLLGALLTPYDGDLMVNAAKRIDAYEAALREIAECPNGVVGASYCPECQRAARNALAAA